MSKYEIVIPAAFGVEASVAFELKRMGMENIKTENGRVIYYGDRRKKIEERREMIEDREEYNKGAFKNARKNKGAL